MSKKNNFSWGKDDSSHEVHHISWPWDDDDDEMDENDESYADEDRVSSRPWGDDNDG